VPKYHFDIRIADCFIPDSQGNDLPDDSAAVDYARAEIRELLMTRAGSKIDGSEARMEISDERKRLLFVVPFADIIVSAGQKAGA
jgi:hypothetical protein